MARILKKIALNITEQEFEALAEFADKDGRTKTEIIREFLRTLPTYQPQSTPDKTA